MLYKWFLSSKSTGTQKHFKNMSYRIITTKINTFTEKKKKFVFVNEWCGLFILTINIYTDF